MSMTVLLPTKVLAARLGVDRSTVLWRARRGNMPKPVGTIAPHGEFCWLASDLIPQPPIPFPLENAHEAG